MAGGGGDPLAHQTLPWLVLLPSLMGGQCLVRIDNHYHAEEDYYGSMMGPGHSTYSEAPEAK